jgi:hemolysin III
MGQVGRLVRRVKDPFPGLSHLFGVVLSAAGLVVLLVAADGRPLHVIGFAVYGATLILLYLASTLAHCVHCSPRAEDRLERFDYAAIFLLIAGTYTPVCLVTLRGVWGWAILAAEWAMAALGIVSVVAFRTLKSWPRVLIYLCMGWLAVAAAVAGPLLSALPAGGLAWLLAGGVAYSLGAVVFITDRPNLWPGRFVAHDLWHVMVLAGSACHFVLMLRFVA